LESAIVLGLGRALGETMAIILVAGNSTILPTSLLDSVRPLTTNIAPTKNIPPNNPYIIDGIPASASVANLTNVTSLPCLAYSCKYIALSMPRGVAIKIDTATV